MPTYRTTNPAVTHAIAGLGDAIFGGAHGRDPAYMQARRDRVQAQTDLDRAKLFEQGNTENRLNAVRDTLQSIDWNNHEDVRKKWQAVEGLAFGDPKLMKEVHGYLINAAAASGHFSPDEISRMANANGQAWGQTQTGATQIEQGKTDRQNSVNQTNITKQDMANKAAGERQGTVNETTLKKQGMADSAAMERTRQQGQQKLEQDRQAASLKPVIVPNNGTAYIPRDLQGPTGFGDIMSGNVAIPRGGTVITPQGARLEGQPVPVAPGRANAGLPNTPAALTSMSKMIEADATRRAQAQGAAMPPVFNAEAVRGRAIDRMRAGEDMNTAIGTSLGEIYAVNPGSPGFFGTKPSLQEVQGPMAPLPGQMPVPTQAPPPPVTNPPPAVATNPGPPALPPENPALAKARDAIARGADRAAVIKRLQDAGIDPTGI